MNGKQVSELAVWVAGCFFGYHAVLSLFGIGTALAYAESGSELTPNLPVLVTGYVLPPVLFALAAFILFSRRHQIASTLISRAGESSDTGSSRLSVTLVMQALGAVVLARGISLLTQLGTIFSEDPRNVSHILYLGMTFGVVPDLILFGFSWVCFFRSGWLAKIALPTGPDRSDQDENFAEMMLAVIGIFLILSILPNLVSTSLRVAWETSGTENTISDTLLTQRCRLLFETAGEVTQVIAGVLLFLGRTRLLRLWRRLRPMAA